MFKITHTSFINHTNIYHALVAINIQLTVYHMMGDWWVGAALGTGFYWGREHTQALVKLYLDKGWKNYLQAYEASKSWDFFMVYNKKYWPLDSIMDLAIPAACTACLAIAMPFAIELGGYLIRNLL